MKEFFLKTLATGLLCIATETFYGIDNRIIFFMLMFLVVDKIWDGRNYE